MNRFDYYRTRKPFTPEHGKTYENEGGGRYTCVDWCPSSHHCIMRSAGGWEFVACGVGIYEDGKIDWDYSLGGEFADVLGCTVDDLIGE